MTGKARARARLAHGIAAAAAAGFVAFGLWVSLHNAVAAWKADSDTYVTVALWEGVRAHGLGFVRTWGFTEDNWLFSLAPFTSLAYAAFGASPRVAVLVGWAVFVASTGLTAALAWRLAGRWAALGCGVLLFANYYAVGPVGFLAYPISHDVSMAWGLAILLLAVIGIEEQAYAPCLAAAGLLFVDAISDPWASAAVGAPLLLASGALAAVNRRTRRDRVALALAAAALAALWVAYKHPFGTFRYLPRGHFTPGGLSASLENLRLGYRALALTFHIAPGGNLDAPAVQAASFLALAALLAFSAAIALAGLRKASPGRQLVTVTAVLSIGAVSVLYVLGPPNTALYVGRFFVNIPFFGALLAVIAATSAPPAFAHAARVAAAGYAALFAAAGFTAPPRTWTAPLAASEPADALALGRWLRAQGLAYGYGAYWGAQALAMDTLTKGAVTIRPVVFADGRFARRPVETSRLWYAPGAEPPQARPFLVITPDLEGCPSPAACEAAARAQFGAPRLRLVRGDAIVLAWDRPLAGRIAP